eukprot:CAMPEP_0183364274 /NCGR_PEP_ID=MMETSP0164_2-20130417/79229_1 /TAXON_ID=221442 /ORGANISM="Coccolithus pelagicus ssp braarudi, Strain PLY182g" /LENGTH=111 /DNA_ID=CAMNT_0025539533 /DNA_START=11 /DNA_END=346 /DNA_ORIENTATION=+
MGVVRALKQVKPLQMSSGGARLLGTAQVILLGKSDAPAVLHAAQQLHALRREYDELREEYEQCRQESQHPGVALAASKAIILLRPGRDAISEAAAEAEDALKKTRKKYVRT